MSEQEITKAQFRQKARFLFHNSNLGKGSLKLKAKNLAFLII